jgi:arylsulfatase
MFKFAAPPHWSYGLSTVALALTLVAVGHIKAQAQQQKPNILVIMGDDIGWVNPSAYHQGIMGYQTPNIDRIAKEGGRFTDWYGQQSCTAGRAAFVTGQSPIRTGLTKVGLPGADIGLRAEDPSVAEILEPLGYATGQFARATWATRTSSSLPIMASMSSSATSTT